MKISQRNIDQPGLVNGRLLRQNPTHLEDHPLKGGYVLRDDGRLGLEQGIYPQHEAEEQGFLDAPLQGMLFPPPAPKRQPAARQHQLMVAGVSDGPHTFPSEVQKEHFHRQLISSDMPSELMSSLSGLALLERAHSPLDRNWSGWYTAARDTVHARPKGDEGVTSADTVMHELGHRADYRSHLAAGRGGADSPSVPRLVHPNPRLEGIADAFTDRYLHRRVGLPTFSHISDTGGYSSQYSGSVQGDGHTTRQWSDAERAVYAAARAHFSETGENPTIPGKEGVVVKDNLDEYLHMMQRVSPHARKALMQLAPKVSSSPTSSLWDAASAASHRYLSGRKIGTQLSMLKEVSAVTDSTPDGPVSTYHSHPVGLIVDPSLLSDEAASSELNSAERMVSNFPLPEGHVLDEGFATKSLQRELYDDPYADGVSHEQHAATVAKELEAEKLRRSGDHRPHRPAWPWGQ